MPSSTKLGIVAAKAPLKRLAQRARLAARALIDLSDTLFMV
jgi:hypothetical protein